MKEGRFLKLVFMVGATIIFTGSIISVVGISLGNPAIMIAGWVVTASAVATPWIIERFFER
jgi:ABC-type transport system involved in cytochrome bd biosynthesis fused ATPase/permease subunit